jgi:hypothetical protein
MFNESELDDCSENFSRSMIADESGESMSCLKCGISPKNYITLKC